MPIKWERTECEQMIRALYKSLFDREPEREVFDGLAEYFAEGRLSVRTQVMRMIKSDEFFDKQLRGKTPEEVAGLLYRYILAREAESPEALKGAAEFVSNAGWRVQVDVMINSEEYVGQFGDDAAPTAPASDEPGDQHGGIAPPALAWRGHMEHEARNLSPGKSSRLR